jgi:hypothetical protein
MLGAAELTERLAGRRRGKRSHGNVNVESIGSPSSRQTALLARCSAAGRRCGRDDVLSLVRPSKISEDLPAAGHEFWEAADAPWRAVGLPLVMLRCG